MAATFYAVSVGPGGADMLTVQALRVLVSCGVICFPETASPQLSDGAASASPASAVPLEPSRGGRTHLAYDAVSAALDLGGKELLFCPVPMTRDKARLEAAYASICDQCAARLAAGTSVAFCALGDVSLYATAAHVAHRISCRGFAVRFVAGVSSVTAAACSCAVELAGKQSPVTLIPADASYAAGTLSAALSATGSKVLLKASRHLRGIIADIDAAGLLPYSHLVQNVSLPDEARYSGDELRSLPDAVFSDAYLSVIIVTEKPGAAP